MISTSWSKERFLQVRALHAPLSSRFVPRTHVRVPPQQCVDKMELKSREEPLFLLHSGFLCETSPPAPIAQSVL